MESSVQTYQQLSVLIEAIMNELHKIKEKKDFTSNHADIHKDFYKLKKKYPTYFKRLLFDENGHYPISEDLDSILQDFQISGIINKLNPGFDRIIINKDDSYSERKKRKIPDVDIKVIKKMAKELKI